MIHNELLDRSKSNIYPAKEFLASKITKKEKLTMYLGIDPTGPTLHLGHAIAIKKLSEFQNAGHKVILLMGDFTAMIGDPDKNTTRVPLTHKQVMANLKNYKKQASALLSFSGKNAAQIKFNSKWLGKMSFEDVIKLASNMTVQQMLERDMFRRRMEEGKPISIHEFMYPLMQGYDSVAMDVDGEIGGNDQTFNMLQGRNLMKVYKNKEKFVITLKLLEDNDGKKMGKTEGNMVALCDGPEEMFGKIMSWNDSLIIPAFELCTDLPMSEVESIARDMASNSINPKDLKMKLAISVVSLYYNKNKAEKAKQNWENTFSKKEIPSDVKTLKTKENSLLVDVLLKEGLVSSKTEFRRLLAEHAITNMDSDEKVIDANQIASNVVYKIGKKRFCKIEII